ncbi:MAG: response regulator [Deltaproteobacteria bacterium]|nr:response regulator [Deltaproteobacteria bacterium]MBW1950765.1 response regulator [Deltaproteobacteria bacterium]MBW2348731.1 response regulator [Deltaproteobacteria bacterium]RLB35266.1 MAG: response regulator [Deltaproteobacteria bacterium]
MDSSGGVKVAKAVLIVEDDLQNRQLVKDLLNIKGYDTIEATNGEEGIAIAKAKKPDLILMDIQMPVMDGIRALEILKGDPETREIPVVAVTAYAMKEDRQKYLDARFDDYVSKPFGTREFLQKVAEYFKK